MMKGMALCAAAVLAAAASTAFAQDYRDSYGRDSVAAGTEAANRGLTNQNEAMGARPDLRTLIQYSARGYDGRVGQVMPYDNGTNVNAWGVRPDSGNPSNPE